MIAVEPAHRAAAAHKAEAKAAPSPTTPDLFSSVFQAAQTERAHQQKVAKQHAADVEPAQRTGSGRTSKPSAKQSTQGESKTRSRPDSSDDNPDLTTSRADPLHESGNQNEIPTDETADEPVEPDADIVFEKPPEQTTDNIEAESVVDVDVPDTIDHHERSNSEPTHQTVVPSDSPIEGVPASVQEPTGEAYVGYVPPPASSNGHQLGYGTKGPRPQTPRSDHASDQSVAATSNKPDANDAADGNPTPRIGLKTAPGIEAKGGELPAHETSRANEVPVKTNDPPIHEWRVASGEGRVNRSPEPVTRQLTVVEGKATTAGVNLNEPKSIGELAHVLRAATTKSGHSSMFLQLDPPELGQVRIDVRLHEQLMTLRFEAQTSAGHKALQSRLADLRGALEQHGVQLGHVSVELRPPAGPEHQLQDAPQQQGGNAQGEFHPDGSGHSQPQEQSGFGAANSSESDGLPGEMLNDGRGANEAHLMGTQKRVDLVI